MSSKPAKGTLERKIWNTCERRESNGHEWTSAGFIAAGHDGYNAEDVSYASRNAPQWFMVEPAADPADDMVQTVPQEGERPPTPPVDPDPPPPVDPPTEPEPQDPVRDHHAMLHDMHAWVTGGEFKFRDRWERRLSWPDCLNRGASRNIAHMRLVCRFGDALQREDWPVVNECIQDLQSSTTHELKWGRHIQEWAGEYSKWNVSADTCLLLQLASVPAERFDAVAQLEELVAVTRAELASWVFRWPDDQIVSRREGNQKLLFSGRGSRDAGGRELVGSEEDMHARVTDAIRCGITGLPFHLLEPPQNGRAPRLEWEIVQALPYARLTQILETQDDLPEDLAPLRTHEPYVIEEYRDGEVATYLLRAFSSQTGSLFYLRQHANGETYEILHAYKQDRVRPGYGPIKSGEAWIEFAEGKRWFCVDNGVDDEIWRIEMRPETAIAQRFTFTRDAAPKIEEFSA